MKYKILYIGNLKLYSDTKLIPISNHTFSYVSWGCYKDPETGEPIACLIGYNDLPLPIGFIRIQNRNSIGRVLSPITSYGTEVRSDIRCSDLLLEEEWNRLGYKVKTDAIGELLYPTYHYSEYKSYYGRHEVEPIDISESQEVKKMVIHSEDLNEFAKLNGISAEDILTEDIELELGEGELIEYGDEE